MAAKRGLGTVLAVALCSWGCSTILGIGDPTYDAGAGSMSGSSTGTDSSGSSSASGGTGSSPSSGGPSGSPVESGALGGSGTGVSGSAAGTGSMGATGSASTGQASTGQASAGSTGSVVSTGAMASTGTSAGSGAPVATQGVGDPCSNAAQGCEAGLTCTKLWCTEACTSSVACGTNKLGRNNVCIVSNAGSQVCFPGCLANSDCAGFPGTNCFFPADACALTHGVGDPCSNGGNECASGLGCGSVTNNLGEPPAGQEGWCGSSCTATTQCAGIDSGGLNGRGQPNYCVVWSTTLDICAPGCASDADCTNFTGTVCGNWATDMGLAATCGPQATSTPCRLDSSVTGCNVGSDGYSCIGAVTPAQVDPTLTCSTGIKGSRGLTLYCCE